MRLVVAVVIGLVARVALAQPAPPPGPTPTPTEEQRAKARELSASAMRKISDANDYGGASDQFLQAYELTGELPFLINAAVSLRKARLPQQAVAAYRRCLAEGGSRLTPELQAQLTADIDHIVRESGQVSVRTEGAAATVELDQRIAGTASRDQPLLVLVSTEGGMVHNLRARRKGFLDATQTLERVRAGELLEITLAPTVIPTTGRVTIQSLPQGAQLRGYGVAPQTVELSPGDHEVWATLPGHEPAMERIEVRAGEIRSITIRLRAIQPSWWAKHKTTVYIAGAVALGTAGAFVTRELLEPDYGQRFDYP